jgi:hypothetical protein
MLGDFNIPNWMNVVPLPNLYYYNKIKRRSIDTATRSLGPDQRNNAHEYQRLENFLFQALQYSLLTFLISISLLTGIACP